MNRRRFCRQTLTVGMAAAYPTLFGCGRGTPVASEADTSLSAVALDGRNIEIERAAVRELGDAMTGPVILSGHPEYDGDTLDSEYRRDLAAGLPIDLPHNYYPDDDPDRPAPVTWRAHGDLLFTNWLNYCVYQETPYDLHELVAREH